MTDETTEDRPSGQGGATPHDGKNYQDQWPANPEPSESAAAKGAENDEGLYQVEIGNKLLEELTGS